MTTHTDGESTRSPRGRRSRFRIVGIALLLIAVLGGGFLLVRNGVASTNDTDGADAEKTAEGAETPGDGAEEGNEGEEKAPVPVRVSRIDTGTVSAYISSTANLVAENEVKILAEAEGRVARLLVDEGQWVRKGQILATLVREEAEIALNKARLAESNARLAYDRAKELYDTELLSREEFDNQSIEFEIAQQEVADAEWKLSKTEIRSPFTGRLSERLIQLGQHVRLGDELFQVTDFEPLIARIYLPEKDILGLEEGRAVRITLNASDDVRFAGAIRWISPVVDVETGTVKLTIEATDPPPQVRPGSFVTIDIVRESRQGAVLLPRQSVLRELKRAHVFVARDELAEKRAVTLGLEEADWVEVLSGVEAGEEVIVAGQGGLRDGSAVKKLSDEADGLQES